MTQINPPSIESSLSDLAHERLNFVRNNIKTLDPNTSLDIATELSVLIGPILDREADLRQKAYEILIMALQIKEENGKYMAHSKAESMMYASEEYKAYKKASALYEGVLETIRSLRRKVSKLEEEFNVTK